MKNNELQNKNKILSMLLIGPTGSGKTPLGDSISQNELWGNRWCHFDFGAELRSVFYSDTPYNDISKEDKKYIDHLLKTNSLFEDTTFYLAKNIFKSFCNRMSIGRKDRILLNGLPRHVGQAKSMNDLIQIEKILYLTCSPQTVYERIVQNSGGDRTLRKDDSVDEIKRKLHIFTSQTVPLLDYYTERNVPIQTLAVAVDTNPYEIMKFLC